VRKALSDDLRLRIHEAGAPAAEVAEHFAIWESPVTRLKRRFRETGPRAPKPGGRGLTPKRAARQEELRAAVAEPPDRTPAEHLQQLGLGVSRGTVMRCIRVLGLTRKKNWCSPPNTFAWS
jgi:transposase